MPYMMMAALRSCVIKYWWRLSNGLCIMGTGNVTLYSSPFFDRSNKTACFYAANPAGFIGHDPNIPRVGG
jgi:hypothetical protein